MPPPHHDHDHHHGHHHGHKDGEKGDEDHRPPHERHHNHPPHHHPKHDHEEHPHPPPHHEHDHHHGHPPSHPDNDGHKNSPHLADGAAKPNDAAKPDDGGTAQKGRDEEEKKEEDDNNNNDNDDNESHNDDADADADAAHDDDADSSNGKNDNNNTTKKKKPMFKVSTTYGSSTDGTTFDHGQHRSISKIVVYTDGHVVKGLAVTYANGTTKTSGCTTKSLKNHGTTLEFQTGELITAVTVRANKFVQSLAFHTNRGNTLGPVGGKGWPKLNPFGNDPEGTEVKVSAPVKWQLCGLLGRASDQHVDQIAFRWGPVPGQASSNNNKNKNKNGTSGTKTKS